MCRFAPVLFVLGLLPLAAGGTGPDVIPLAVRAGQCTVVLPDEPGEQYLLILGALARAPGPYSVTLQTECTKGPPHLDRDQPAIDPAWRQRIADLQERQDRSRKAEPPPDFPPSSQPPRQRTFWLFTGDHGFQKSENHTAVTGVLLAIGRHCQVYADRDLLEPATLQPTIDDIVRTFDGEIFPVSRQRLGRAPDIDRDGRFTILLTPWLGKLCQGQVALGGYVRAADFDRDQPPPFGNCCDMMYLNSDLRPGPHLRTLLAHEYTHAIVHGQRRHEESWLDEGLAHLAEELHGHSWSNLDYRISAYLNAPERYPLVVPDDSSAGRWRCPGLRGADFLFLRSCVQRDGVDLLGRLARTSLLGLNNLEVATGTTFAELFRNWCIQTALEPMEALAAGTILPAFSLESRRNAPFCRLLCGPRFIEVPLSGGAARTAVAGTAAAYFLLHSPAGPCRIQVAADPAAALQATLVRLTPGAGRLSLSAVGEGPGVRLRLTAYQSDVTLTSAAWERLVPSKNRQEDTNFRPEECAGVVREWFGALKMKGGESRASPVLLIPGEGEWVFKVAGIDSTGRRVAGWTVWRLE